MFNPIKPKQIVSSARNSAVVQVGSNNSGNITIQHDPLAQQALEILSKQLDDMLLGLVEKERLIQTQQETILNLVSAKQSNSLLAPSVDEALQEIIATGNTDKAKALLTKQIDDNGDAITQQAKLYHQRSTLFFATDTYAALSDFVRATQLDPDFAEAWNASGRLYQRLGQLDDALAAFTEVSHLGKRLNKDGLISVALGNMGIIYKIRGKPNKALEMQKKALKLNQKLGRKEGMAANYGNMGVVYKTLGELDKALEMYRQSLELCKGGGQKEVMASNYGNMGIIYKNCGELDKAKKLWENSLALFNEVSANPKIHQVQQWLDQLARNLGGDK